MMVVHSDKTITADAVQAQLKDLPPTEAPVIDTSATPTPGATAKRRTTATATPSATATATPTQTFPVSVTSVLVGENNNTYRVETKNNLDVPEVNQAVYILFAQNGPLFVQNKSTASAAIGAETTRNAILAVLAAAIAIMFFIAYAFRHVGTWRRSFRFGVSAIIALLHDVLVVLGIWAILGHFFDFKVDSLFLTAVLTVVGFSVHDTIVVFDRIRENLSRRTSETFETDRGREPDPDDVALDQHLVHGAADVDGAGALRRRVDPRVHPRAADRHPVGHLLLDLQRQHDPDGLGDGRVAHHVPSRRPEGGGACLAEAACRDAFMKVVRVSGGMRGCASSAAGASPRWPYGSLDG